MLKNFFTVAMRNIFKHKFYSFLNIFGLTIGITAALFIVLYLSSELSYDRFHRNIDRMYKVGLHARMGNQDLSGNFTPYPMAAALSSEIPEISDAIRLWRWSDVVIKYGDKSFTEDGIFHADSNFFRFFTFPLIKGDPNTVLSEPNSIVLSESSARKIFGNEDPVGKLLTFSNANKTMKVTGVARNAPDNSHIKFNYIVSFSSLDQRNNKSGYCC